MRGSAGNRVLLLCSENRNSNCSKCFELSANDKFTLSQRVTNEDGNQQRIVLMEALKPVSHHVSSLTWVGNLIGTGKWHFFGLKLLNNTMFTRTVYCFCQNIFKRKIINIIRVYMLLSVR